MNEFEYVVVSTAVIDRVRLSGGKLASEILGGAGVYALSGLRLWSDSAVLVTGVGGDFPPSCRRWFDENGCSREGLMVKDAHTAISELQYLENGERVETPPYGKDHYLRLEAEPKEIAPFLRRAKGMYVFKDDRREYWEELLPLAKGNGCRILWEINAEAALPERRGQVERIARQCDVFSINRAEACSLFGSGDLTRIEGELRSWGLPLVYLRLGGRGARALTPEGAVSVPPVPGIRVTDPTGAGNSSSAAVLYGFCRGESPEVCGLRGSISAAACIAQYGPPRFSPEGRRAAEALLQKMTDELEGRKA